MRISQFVFAGAVSAAGLVGFGGVANAAPIPGPETVACVAVGSSDGSASIPTPCGDPACADGALTVVVDDSGVQHLACVASAVPVPPANTARVTFVLPVDAASTAAVLPATGRGSGDGLALAAVLVGCGSLASFVSRRRV